MVLKFGIANNCNGLQEGKITGFSNQVALENIAGLGLEAEEITGFSNQSQD